MPPTVAIVGAGIGGLTFAIGLKRQLGFENFIIFEKGPDLGGTWRENIYPGCSSDVPILFYSLSTEQQDWPSSHGYQDEILAYWQRLASKYNIPPHIHYNQQVVSATWDATHSRYEIVTTNPVTKHQHTTYAEILISAVGILNIPHVADIPGAASFKGSHFHSARWNKGVELRGKKVAVIGNATSASQFVPRISQDPSVDIVNFCRTPNWYFPPMRKDFSFFRRWLMNTIPGVHRLMRWWTYWRMEWLYVTVFSVHFTIFRSVAASTGKKYILANAPEKYHKYMIPSFPAGCKRLIVDTGYLEALHRPNLQMNWDGIDRMVEDGIITKKGEHLPFDVVIYATGFVTDSYPLPIYGQNGLSIKDYFKQHGGANTYGGITVAGFPNFFMLLGPNTNTGHTSNIFSIEVQTNYTIQLIKPILQGKLNSVEVKGEAVEKYEKHLHSRLDKSVFTQCSSWYRVGGKGKITSIFPGGATRYWWYLRKPKWNEYETVPGGYREGSWLQALVLVLTLTLAVAAYGYRYPETWRMVLDWALDRTFTQSIKKILS